VIALAREDQRARATLREAWKLGTDVVVPAVVVAETVRADAAHNTPVTRVLNMVDKVVPLSEQTARLAGMLLARAKSAATIDALIVAEAVQQGGGVILTGDATDLEALASGHPSVSVQAL
jgi:predicted nucleic acid-binding protein